MRSSWCVTVQQVAKIGEHRQACCLKLLPVLRSLFLPQSVPCSELVLVLCNSADTDNPLNDELGEDQYMNITVEQELNFPDTSFLASVLSLAQVTLLPRLCAVSATTTYYEPYLHCKASVFSCGGFQSNPKVPAQPAPCIKSRLFASSLHTGLQLMSHPILAPITASVDFCIWLSCCRGQGQVTLWTL